MFLYHNIAIEDMEVSFFFTRTFTSALAEADSLHYHLNYEIHNMVSGAMSYVMENETYTLDNNAVLIIPPNTLHQSTNVTYDTTKFSFEFSISQKENSNTGLFKAVKNLLDNTVARPYLTHLEIPELEMLKNMFHNPPVVSPSLYSINEALIHSYISIIFSKILLYLQQNISSNNDSNCTRTLTPVHSFSTKVSIYQYVASNYIQNSSVHDLANELHLSVRQTERLVKKETNSTFTELVNNHRIKLAQHYIRTSILNKKNKTLEEISNLVGFCKYSTFLKQFKIYTGMSPTEYKRLYAEFIEKN